MMFSPRRVFGLALACLLTACADAPPPKIAAPDTSAAPPPASEKPKDPMAQLLSPGEHIKPGALTAAEASHVVTLVSQLPDEVAFKTLHAYGPGISSAVRGLLASKKPLDRVAGVRLTHNLRLLDHRDRLVELVRDPDARVRRAVAKAIRDIGEPAHVAALAPLMKDAELYIRLSSQFALAAEGDRSLVENARHTASVERQVFRLRALQALADVSLPEDAEWFSGQVRNKDLDPKGGQEVWRGYAAADPDAALKELTRQRAKKKTPVSEHTYHVALKALAPAAPEAVVLTELDRATEANPRRLYRQLAHAVSRTRGAQAEARTEELLGKERWACEVIIGRLSAQKEWSQRLARFKRAVKTPGKSDAALLNQRIAALQADLDWIGPLADSAWSKQQQTVLDGGPFCRLLADHLTDARIDSLEALLANASAAVRSKAAKLLGKAGSWRHLRSLATVYHDKDAAVRASARTALRLILGIDLRLAEGFLWKSWFVHTFGPLPAQHHPAEGIEALMKTDLKTSIAERPFGSKQMTTTDKALQPRPAKPASGPATGRAPRK